jgi:hypothetical protein
VDLSSPFLLPVAIPTGEQESIMNARRARIAIVALALVAASTALSGCGSSLCSRDEFFDTAFGVDHREHARSAAASAANVSTVERGV